MDTLDIFIILLLAFLAYTLLKKIKYNDAEHLQSIGQIKTSVFSPYATSSTNSLNINSKENSTKKTKTVIHPIDLLEDASFSDVQFFRSEPIWGQETGLQKCMNICNGTCVEFGMTNDAMCFPR